MQMINGIPFSMLLILAALGVIIFIGFNLYRRLILPMMLLKDSGKAHQKSFARTEIIVWMVYVITVIYFALVKSLPVTMVLLALVVFAFFDFWKNYFAGIILKFGDKLQCGDSITVNEHTGTIVEFGNRAIKMMSDIGEEMLIPYRLVNTEVKIGQKSTPKTLLKTFVLENEGNKQVGTKQKIESAIYNNPWIIISNPVNVMLEGEKATLSFYVLNKEFYEKAKQRLVKDLEH